MNHWSKRKDWQLVGSPLIPNDEDLANFRAFPETFISEPLNIMVLGATLGLIMNNWKNCDTISTVDNVRIRLELADKLEAEKVLFMFDDWLTMTCPIQSNYIIGDGSIHCVEYDKFEAFAKNIHKHTTQSGYLALRVFLPQMLNEETPKMALKILKDFEEFKISSFHDFKRQLMCSLIDAEYKVVLEDVYNTFILLSQSTINKVFEHFDWNPDLLKTMDSFRNSKCFYTFPPKAAIFSKLEKYFRPISFYTSSYQNSDNYPVIVFKKV